MEKFPHHNEEYPIADSRPLHRIEDDLAEGWIEDWAGAGVAEIEDYLTKHAAFLIFLEAQDDQSSSEQNQV